MKSDTPTTPRGLGRTRQRACLSSDSSEKISNYLNIWRIAVSSDRALPYPLKPREMHKHIRKDAGGRTKVNAHRHQWKQVARSTARVCRVALVHKSVPYAKTRLFSIRGPVRKHPQIG